MAMRSWCRGVDTSTNNYAAFTYMYIVHCRCLDDTQGRVYMVGELRAALCGRDAWHDVSVASSCGRR